MTRATAIAAPPAPKLQHTAILGVGAYRPRREVPNAEIVDAIDSSDEWIQSRSGIKSRRFAGEDETILMMSVEAAKDALRAADMEADQIDGVIIATNTRMVFGPSMAPQVALALGRNNIAAFDITAGCSGFSTALANADSLIRGGTLRNVLVVGVERLSDFVDKHDRTCAFIFADGAGAAVVGPSEEVGIGAVSWGADGNFTNAIYQDKDFSSFFDEVEEVRGGADIPERPYIRMEGRQVFRWCATFLLGACQEALTKAGMQASDIEVFIPHQANIRITQVLTKALELPEDVVIAEDIVTTGNTSAASIPLAMEELIRSGKAKPGQRALVMAFGSGLAYAGQVVTLPPVSDQDA
ncbi:ketoacyl-ACP synthase III [Tsukamurella sp. 8F]|uniref:beta-ketoacyl-ACP synthase III n=1 Tax=unclassified Tsukamurella TaxID=2633480 RepID=UPI0023B94E93|nr:MULTISPECIES: beta-ketoacyl-ACP synthase III [unclassified Tsukamurella]MDF0530573.1 ketoacyl-ACP synthase III [Tsukamurella sp. 8J]MDF0586777.1 ketoacyl-ACP synthase III [Tsukamurella sp. 8F]